MRVGLLNRIFVAHNLMPKSWEPCSVVGTVTWILFRLWALLHTYFVYILYYRIFKFNVQGSVHRKYIPLDIFPTRCNITQFIYFWKTALHVSGGISTHHQEHTQLYLQYLVFVKPLLLPAAIAEELELVWVWCGNCIDLFWCGCVSRAVFQK